MDDHWRVTLSGINDASAIYASVDTQVTDKINVALKYSEIDVGSNSNDLDQNEIYIQTAYKMSKNLSTYVRLGQLEKDNFYTDGSDLKSNMGRVHVQYSF
jgi:predicted porin